MVLLRLLRIHGQSLEPEYRHGDFVLISGLGRLRRGDVIVFQQPGYGLLIKQLRTIQPDGSLEVYGAGPRSVDSRVFGPVQKAAVLGKVILHIHP